MFLTKLTKLQAGIPFFFEKYPTANIVYPDFREESFQLSWELDRPKAIIPLPGSVLASPENIQTEAFSGY